MTTLQDIMGLITKRKIKTPSDNDYIISAAYTDTQERLKPQPKMEASLLSLGGIKKYVLGSIAPPKYKVYTALLTQTGTNAPVATVLENTTDLNITYTYSLVGKYIINLNSPIPKQKVTIEVSNFRYASTLGDSGIYFLEMVDDVANIGIYQLNTKFRTNAAAAITFANGALNNNKIEIRIYN
jgi:hypothetical protein